jgi:hypothetical protein
MKYNHIIEETVTRYLNNIINEAQKSSHEAAESYETEYGENLSKSDEERIRKMLNNDVVNVSAIAQKVYPDHTKEGAQSQLRKAIKGEKNDNGSEYHVKQKVGTTILGALKDVKVS